ncbi:MAG: glycosyltransferase family 2 protein [Dorea sp.]|jgi:rhamnosyltransferase|nr:glycosyltransferase family 2 protein [Dorea sp.]
MKDTKIDVVIPVYKPGMELKELLRRLSLQRQKIGTVYLMHTKDGNNLKQSELTAGYDNIIIEEIDLDEFDHGGTRDKGIGMSDSEYVLFMTQDAIPADRNLTVRLMEAMSDTDVAVAYARQLPKKDCHLLERYIRAFNYPAESMVKQKEDLNRLGIKTYFCSDVCALYRKELYVKQGGFENRIIFNEDMLYAAKSIQNGYKIVYAADAKVIHSHNYTNMQQFRRNFDLAVSQVQHPEVFGGVKSEKEGIRMIKNTALHFIKHGRPMMVVRLLISSAAKYLGYLAGKHYEKLPADIVEKCSMSPAYWRFYRNSKKSWK